jgi:hypothetical protein
MAFGDILPLPALRLALPLARTFDATAIKFFRRGFSPCVPEQRWVLRYRCRVLRIRRNSRPFCKFEVRLAKRGDLWEVTGAWVNRDPDQYEPTEVAEDLDLLEHLIERLASGDFAEESRLPFSAYFGDLGKPQRKA